MKIIALALALLLSSAHGQPCMPRSALTPSAPGGELVIVGTVLDEGAAVGMWCPADATKCPGIAPGQTCWIAFRHPWLHKYATQATQAYVARVMAAPAAQWTQTAADAITATRVVPQPGSRDECKLQQIDRRLCLAMGDPATAGLGAAFKALPPERCGVAKDCSALPDTVAVPPSWLVSRAGMAATATTRPAYPLTNGVRGTTSTARAPLGATCDCTVGVTEGASRYCAFDSSKAMVTLCRVQ